jgi:hypothetical protein
MKNYSFPYLRQSAGNSGFGCGFPRCGSGAFEQGIEFRLDAILRQDFRRRQGFGGRDGGQAPYRHLGGPLTLVLSRGERKEQLAVIGERMVGWGMQSRAFQE